MVEVASSRLHFASRACLLQLLQQTYPALCHQPAWNSVLVLTITKIQFFLVRPDNMPRSTYKCLNIYYPSNVIGRAKRAPHWGVQSRFRVIYICRYVCRMSNHVESRESNTRMLKVSIGRSTRIIRFDYTLEQL